MKTAMINMFAAMSAAYVAYESNPYKLQNRACNGPVFFVILVSRQAPGDGGRQSPGVPAI